MMGVSVAATCIHFHTLRAGQFLVARRRSPGLWWRRDFARWKSKAIWVRPVVGRFSLYLRRYVMLVISLSFARKTSFANDNELYLPLTVFRSSHHG